MLITCMQRWLCNEALSRPRLVSPHIVVCPYQLWDLCSSLHGVLLLNALCFLEAMGIRGKQKEKKGHFYLQTATLSEAKLTQSSSTSLCRTEFCH